MKHQDFSSFAFGEFIEKSDPVVGPESVGAETRKRAAFDPERGSELRTALRLAQHGRDALRAMRDRVGEALERANEMSVGLEGKLAEFCELDAEIGENCAAEILRSIDNAEEPTLELSPELQRMSDQRLALEQRLTAARQAGERLRRELAAAECDLNEAESKVEGAAVAVAAFEIEPMVAELAEMDQRASTLRRLLLGYATLRHAGGFLPMSRSAAQLLRGMKGTHDPSMVALWQCYLSRLAIDSTATFDGGFL